MCLLCPTSRSYSAERVVLDGDTHGRVDPAVDVEPECWRSVQPDRLGVEVAPPIIFLLNRLNRAP